MLRHTTRPLTTLVLATLLAGTAQAHGQKGHMASPQAAAPAQRAPAATTPEQTPWGIAGQAQASTRRIDLRMSDAMRFSPDTLTVKLGETVRLVAANTGQVLHELVIGTPQGLRAHAEMMKQHPNMEHDEPHMAHVAPNQAGEIVWTFNRPGEFEFACLIPGHFEAGMVGRITVQP